MGESSSTSRMYFASYNSGGRSITALMTAEYTLLLPNCTMTRLPTATDAFHSCGTRYVYALAIASGNITSTNSVTRVSVFPSVNSSIYPLFLMVATNSPTHPKMKHSPPTGVTGPRISTAPKPVISRVLSTYNDPENNKMPKVNVIKENRI